jgi:transcriptional regulator with XRE-family HTH domain
VSRPKKPLPPPIDWKAVGRRLRELRGYDLTQAEFAEQVGVSQGYLSSAERGQREIGPQVLLRISHVWDKSIEWLLTGKTPKT